jgi:hypothetical protein
MRKETRDKILELLLYAGMLAAMYLYVLLVRYLHA